MQLKSLSDCATLNNGVKMPWIGLGTYKSSPGHETEKAVRIALEFGYRHIDTAALYANEADVGKAIRDSGIPRDQIFVTTKVWNSDLRNGTVAKAFDASLQKLGMDYIDLYLIHWPVKENLSQNWTVLQGLYASQKVRAIGISNFLVHHIDELMKSAEITPAVNQVEWHPWARQQPLLDFCEKSGIVFEAWAPLMQGRIDEIPELAEIGQKYGKSPAQVAIRWGLQHGVVMIPKSVRRERIIENADVFDFELWDEDMRRIDAVDRNQRLGPDPDTFTF
jgi:diketogulonate reductase-like aldo/keto reductase